MTNVGIVLLLGSSLLACSSGASNEVDADAGAGGAAVGVQAGAGGEAIDVQAGAGGAQTGDRAGAGGEPSANPLSALYATSVVSFEPGEGAGYNASKLPGIVLGPPHGKGNSAGSLDVLSLGTGGEIVLGFGEQVIVDGPGADLIVFENAFWPNGDASQVFAELGEVSVSEDGETWYAFPCDTTGDGAGSFSGCAGVTPALAYDPATLVPLEPALTGGDAFDLADLELSRARYVKIRDLATMTPAGTTSGFDLDAVGIVHGE